MNTSVVPLSEDDEEFLSKCIVRTANVNRSRTNMQAMIATGRVPHLNEAVLATLPKGKGDTVTLAFYCPGRDIPASRLEEELRKDGVELVCDPIGQAGVNESDREFADNQPNGTQWKDTHGNICAVVFGYWEGKRMVDIDRWGLFWPRTFWFPVRISRTRMQAVRKLVDSALCISEK